MQFVRLILRFPAVRIVMSTGSFSPRSGIVPDRLRNPLTGSVAAALLCTLVLGFLVLFAGRGGDPERSVPAPDVPDPTHMAAPPNFAIHPVTATPSPAVSPPTATPTDQSTDTPTPTVRLSPTPTPTPSPSATATATPLPTPDPVFELEGAGLAALVDQPWLLRGEILGKSSAPSPGQLWLTAPRLSPAGPFAIEAEIAVDPPAADACDASYGLVVNAQALVWGAGVTFPCDRAGAVTARISDISNPADGYAADRLIRQKPATIDPAGWHTLRLEVRGNDLRLSIDGVLTVKAEDPALWDVDASPALAVGLWSDGIETQVRRFAIYPIDPEARLIP